MSEPDKEAARTLALDIIRDYRDRGCPERTPVDAHQLKRMMNWLVCAVFIGQLRTERPRGAYLVSELTVDLMLFGPAFLIRNGLPLEEVCRVLAKQPLVIGIPRRTVIGKHC